MKRRIKISSDEPLGRLKGEEYMRRSIFFLILLSNSLYAQTPAPVKNVWITQIVEHPSLNQVRKGIEDYFEKKKDLSVKLSFYNAQGDMVLAQQIAGKAKAEKLAAIVTITTPMTQAVLAKKPSFPVIFSVVSDPLAAKLVTSLGARPENVTGVRTVSPISMTVQKIKERIPKAKRIAFLYSLSEDNSLTVLENLIPIATKLGFTVVKKGVSKTTDISSAIQSLAGKADVVLIPQDNLVASALPQVLAGCKKLNLPLVASDSESVKQGALFAYDQDHYKLGIETAKMVEKVLRGENPGKIPVFEPTEFDFFSSKS